MQGSILGPKETVEWCNQGLPISSLANPSICLVQAILWELFELGFQHELYVLDHTMILDLWVKAPRAHLNLLICMWPGQHGENMWKGSLPQQGGDLGFTDVVHQNLQVFKSFCIVLSGWPGTHPSLYMFVTDSGRDVTQQAAYEILSCTLAFYVQSFFN